MNITTLKKHLDVEFSELIEKDNIGYTIDKAISLILTIDKKEIAYIQVNIDRIDFKRSTNIIYKLKLLFSNDILLNVYTHKNSYNYKNKKIRRIENIYKDFFYSDSIELN